MGLNRAQWWPIDFHGLSWKPMVFLLIILASGLQASPTSWYIVSCLSCWKSVFRPPANHAEELWPSEEASGWTPGKPHLWLSQTFQRAGGNQGPRWKSKLGQNHYWELGKNNWGDNDRHLSAFGMGTAALPPGAALLPWPWRQSCLREADAGPQDIPPGSLK